MYVTLAWPDSEPYKLLKTRSQSDLINLVVGFVRLPRRTQCDYNSLLSAIADAVPPSPHQFPASSQSYRASFGEKIFGVLEVLHCTFSALNITGAACSDCSTYRGS